MAYAVETTHRTFKRLLEASSEAIGRTPDNFPRKRVRISDQPAHLRQFTTRDKKAHTPIADLVHTFNPTDREAYRQRLHTFRDDITLWNSKPDLIDAGKWSMKGWRCVARDTVECVTCKERVVVNLDSEGSSGDVTPTTHDHGEDILLRSTSYAESFLLLIFAAHTEFCPWRGAGCDPAINRVDVKGYDKVINSLCSRFESLRKGCNDNENHIRVTIGSEIDLTRAFSNFSIKAYPGSPATSPLNTEDNIALLGLALNGWAPLFESPESAPIVRCDNCLANIGLWDYMETTTPGDSSTVQHQKVLPAHEMHYPDCPWINAEAQSPNLDLPSRPSKSRMSACQVLVTYLGIINDSYDPVAGSASNDGTAREARNQSLLKRAKEVKKAWGLRSGRGPLHSR